MPDNNKIYEQLFYSPKGYWKGESAINKQAEKTNTPQKDAKNGSPNKHFGRSTYLGQNIYQDQSSMRTNQMLFTRLIFYFYHMIQLKEKHTNML